MRSTRSSKRGRDEPEVPTMPSPIPATTPVSVKKTRRKSDVHNTPANNQPVVEQTLDNDEATFANEVDIAVKDVEKEENLIPMETSNPAVRLPCDEHPLTVGDFLIIKYPRDNTNRLAKIIERTQHVNNDWKYYVHYFDFNRRMDEWIASPRILCFPSVANPIGNEATHLLEKQHQLQKQKQQLQQLHEKQKLEKTVSLTSTTSTSEKSDKIPKLKTSQSQTDLKGSAKEQDKKSSNDVVDLNASFASIQDALKKLSVLLSKATGQQTDSSSIQQSMYSTIAELDHDEHEGLDEESIIAHEKLTKIKNIQSIQFGKYIMECWYFSPFPKEYYQPYGYIERLYFDEFTLRFFRTKQEMLQFQAHCQQVTPQFQPFPPGKEIYRDEDHCLSMFELDGSLERIYCQNLCYFAKLFLDHKTLYWDVESFLFYVLCKYDEKGYHPVGYFSKEKYSESGYNLACILSFPFVQRQGYGRFLMEFSYLLSQREERCGSPEKPLSDLGVLGYRSYWASTILRVLAKHCFPSGLFAKDGKINSQEKATKTISVFEICQLTSILPEDILMTLEYLGLMKEMTLTDIVMDYHIYLTVPELQRLLQKYPENKIKARSDRLFWIPFYNNVDPKKDRWSLENMKAVAIQSSATIANALNTVVVIGDTSNPQENKSTE